MTSEVPGPLPVDSWVKTSEQMGPPVLTFYVFRWSLVLSGPSSTWIQGLASASSPTQASWGEREAVVEVQEVPQRLACLAYLSHSQDICGLPQASIHSSLWKQSSEIPLETPPISAYD